jgi:hypothetical protein
VAALGYTVKIVKSRFVVGMRLWVRETWRHALAEHGPCWAYRADETYACGKPVPHDVQPSEKWRPSIFMPRNASRLTLEVIDVRVDRLHSITGEDAVKEGVESREAYAALWDQINYARCPWAKNPWIYRLEFRVMRP